MPVLSISRTLSVRKRVSYTSESTTFDFDNVPYIGCNDNPLSSGVNFVTAIYFTDDGVPQTGLITEPFVGDTSTFKLRIELQDGIPDTLSVLALGRVVDISTGAENTYYEYMNIPASAGVVGYITAYATEVEIDVTRELFYKIKTFGVAVYPQTEFGTHGSQGVITSLSGAEAEYELRNSMARGRAVDITPENYATIIAGEDTAVGYTYRHDLGGYAQAFLGVRAVNADTGDVVTIAHKRAVSVADGGRGTFTIAAGTLSAGTWNITISAAPAAAENYYSDSDPYWTTGQTVTYTVRENSEVGNVSCDGRPIPMVSWTATSQAAYQVRFGDYDSGARAGTVMNFTVPRIFADGAYPVRVRTANTAGTWSEWSATLYATVRNVQPSGSFSAAASQLGQNIAVSWTAFTGASKYAVFRDGKMIGVVGSGVRQFVDRIGAGGQYEVYAVTSARYYRPSEKIAGRLNLAADLLSSDGGYSWIALKFTPSQKSEPEDLTADMAFVHYAGREKPVAYRSGQKTRRKTFGYIFKDRARARALRALIGAEVLIKTTRGEHIRGVITEMNFGDGRFASPSFEVREVYGEEDGLEYPTE